MVLAKSELDTAELWAAPGGDEPQASLIATIERHPGRWSRPTVAAATAVRTLLTIDQWIDRLERIEGALMDALGPLPLRPRR